MTKTQIAKEFRDKYGLEMPTKQLARIMYAEHPLMFNNLENARDFLRYIEGKKGKQSIKDVNNKYRVEAERSRNPYNLPKSDESEYVPYVIEGKKRIGLLFDIHAPYHSIEALTTAFDYLKSQSIDLLVLGGDFFDFYGLSRFLKDPNKRRFGAEIACGVELLQIMHQLFQCPIIYKLGNHDERFQHFLWQKWAELGELGEIEELRSVTLENIIRNRLPKDFPLTVVDDKRIIKAGNLNIVHGHEFPSGIMSPVNIARGLFLRAKASAICGHHHRSSEHTEMDMNGKITTTFSVGCLCELTPAYMPINSWNHGFAVVDLNEDGSYHLHNKRIYKGEVL